MNILIITPIYYIKDRNNLFHDTSAIHYLIKPWAMVHRVVVIHVYSQSFGKIVRYFDRKERLYRRNGYHFNADGIEVHICEVQRFYKQPAILNAVQGRRVTDFIRRVTREGNFVPDVIVSHCPTSTLQAVSKIFKTVPRAAVFHTTDVLNINRYEKLCKEIEVGYQYTYARSEKIRRYFKEKGLRSLQEEIIHSGAPLADFTKREYCKPQQYRILYAGKLIKRKHIDLLIKALANLQKEYDFHLTVFGEGPEFVNLKSLAEAVLKKNIYEFHPFLPRDLILEEMSKADLFVMPSTGETLGLVYLEAMSKGCVTIGTAGEGIDGIIKDGENGYLVSPNDVNDLERKLRYVFDLEDEAYRKITDRAQETAFYYNEADMGLRYLKLVTKGIDKNNQQE